ncbi:MAG: hypothetical protein HY321_02745 [Armatimonadetes bacterium]|nr:hypothetical protein [Armatimonadota bacterium]
MISLAHLRALAAEHLGTGLCHATPERVREFLDRVSLEMAPPAPPGERYTLAEPVTSYEAIIRGFFWESLHAPPEQAVVMLWLMGLEAALGSDWHDEP